MKTAVSVPDKLYASAEKFAKSHKISRSELYQQALEKFLKDNSSTQITEQLNQVYADEDSSVPAALRKMQARGIRKTNESW